MQAVIQLEQAVENMIASPNIGLHFGKAGSKEGYWSLLYLKNEMVFVFCTLFSARYKC
jgi:hypothetical protein